MRTFRADLKVRPPWLHPGTLTLNARDVSEVLDGAILHTARHNSLGQIVLDVSMKRGDHVAAINDLFVALQRLGYTLINGEVSAIADSAVDGAVYGGLGSGAIGLASNNAWIAGSAAVVGAIVGTLVGRELKRVEVVYQVHPNLNGGWTFSPVPAQAQPQTGLAAA